MAYSFGDSFDLYAAVGDMVNGYWDSSASFANVALSTTVRFAGQSLQLTVNSQPSILVKSSGQNDAVHHIVFAYRQSAAISGSTIGAGFSLWDGTTQQCSIAVRSDGAILLQSGGFTGTTLATYTGAVTAINTWYAFEVEIVINNTTGSFKVRKNGNNVDDFSATSLNTRGGTANNYANKISIGANTAVVIQFFDDFFWQSSAAAGTWLGDIRCYVRMPASDASVTFSRSSASFTLPVFSASGAQTLSGGIACYAGLTSQGGTLTSANAILQVGFTGNLKCAIFACTSTLGASNSVGAILGTATAPIVNPVAGSNIFTFSPTISLPYGTLFYVGICPDVTTSLAILAGNAGPYTTSACLSTTSYASFPVASPVVSVAATANRNTPPLFTGMNSLFVSETQQDATTTYIYDSTVGHEDFYGIASISATPATVIATTARAYAIKSDAGTRTAAVQVKSGATTVASTTLVLTTSGWQWAWRTDTTDPATGAAWTPAAVNTAQIGPKVIA